MEIKIKKPFGPSIAKAKIPKEILDKINNHVDEIVASKNKKTELDHGQKLAGDVSEEILLSEDFVRKSGWLDFLGKCVYQWIFYETNKKISKFELIGSWVVRQFQNEYNPIHWHNGHVSGVGYLKLPKTFGNWKQNKTNKIYQGGQLDLIHGSKMFLSESRFKIKPELNDLYLFPNYLMHTVYPFKNSENEERRSVSFNAIIDNNIYNVYSD